MTLLDMQRAFSRMLTDGDFQRAFLAGDRGVLHGYQLTERELLSLRGLPGDRMSLQAVLLAGSRVELALKTVPLTSALLHDQLHRHVHRFCAEFPPVPMAAGQAAVESARLCEFILRLLDEGLLTPYWARDVVVFERTRFSLGVSHEAWESGTRALASNELPLPAADADLLPLVPASGPHVRVGEFRHDLIELIPRVAAGEVPGATPLDRPLRVLFVRVPGIPTVQPVKVNEATVALLDSCDGRRTCAEVLDRLAVTLPPAGGAGADRAELDRRALAALRGLREMNAIALRPVAAPAPGGGRPCAG